MAIITRIPAIPISAFPTATPQSTAVPAGVIVSNTAAGIGAISQVGRVAAIAVPLAVDVGDQNAAPPAILRGGVQVVPPQVITTKVDDFVDNLVPIQRFDVPRVLSQSVPANTRVAVGTTIDLVLVPVDNINVNLLSGVTEDLAASQTLLVSDLLPIVQQPAVQTILAKTTDPTTLSDADKATITNAYTQATGFQVNEADPTRNFATTFGSLQSIRSFQ
jgi:hypothetical protein